MIVKKSINQNALNNKNETPERERKNILALYIFFFFSTAASMSIHPQIAMIALMLAICMLALLYSIRMRVAAGSFVDNHVTFMIRTFWRANLYLVGTFVLGALYLLFFTDYAPLKPCFTYLTDRSVFILQHWKNKDYTDFFYSCTAPFFKKNTMHVFISLSIMFVPILVYLLNRVITGWNFAWSGNKITESKL